MVSVTRFRIDAENLINEIEQRCNNFQNDACYNFIVTRNIQRIFRGYITRKHIEILNKRATCIQKNWRAFVDSLFYEKLLKERFRQLCRIYYTEMATTIQKHWRAFWVRSKVFNYYKLKNWLKFVRQQNRNLSHSTQKYQRKQDILEIEKREKEAKEWIVYILYKLHHLLRTQQISGIYSLPKTRNLSDIEKMLTCLKFKDFMIFYNTYKEDVRQKRVKKMPPYILQGCKYSAHFEREWYEHKMKHQDKFCDQFIPQVARYENKIDTNKDIKIPQVNIQICECSYCTHDKL